MTNRITVPASLHQKDIRPFYALAALFTSLMLWTGHGLAGTWQHTVTSSITAEHESNPALTPVSRGSVRRALFTPRYTLARTDGSNELRAGLALQVARSSNTALSLNREDPSAFASWLRQSQTGEFGVTAKYDEAATRTTESGTIGAVAVDGTRKSRSLAANLSKPLSDRSTLAADGSYTNITYKGGTYVDYVTRSAGLRLTHDWSESISPFLAISHLDQTPSGNALRNRQTSAIAGMNIKFSERLDGSVQAGRSRASGTNNYHSSQYGMSMQYTGLLNRLSLRAGRQTSASGLGSLVTADDASGDWSHELSERTRIGANLGWRKNRTISDEYNRTIGASLQHHLDASWIVGMHYQRRVREISGLSASTSLLGISLDYSYSNF